MSGLTESNISTTDGPIGQELASKVVKKDNLFFDFFSLYTKNVIHEKKE